MFNQGTNVDFYKSTPTIAKPMLCAVFCQIMNEDKLKVYIGNKRKTKQNLNYAYQSYFVKPAGKFWKRYFNKKVRKGAEHKKGGWWDWS
jgi:hypothetical protein